MKQAEQVREMIATMLRMPPDEVRSETLLASLSDSLGGARLRLGLKRLGLSFPNASPPATFGELQTILGENPTSATVEAGAPAADPVSNSAGPVQIGLDAQDVRALPVASDYWDHEFYSGVFGKAEIAYAVGRSEPRVHLAGFWAAKEALRKCDPAFTTVDLASVIVEHESGGKPHFSYQVPSGWVRLPHVLSLSHTGDLAMAVVVKLRPPALPREEKPAASPASPKPGVLWPFLFLITFAGFMYLLIERLRGI